VTPLQVANMTAAVANGGKVFQPHVVRHVDKAQKDGCTNASACRAACCRVKPAALKAVREGLWVCRQRAGRHGRNSFVEGLIVGKTGSVQVIAYSADQGDVVAVQVPRPRMVRVVRAGDNPQTR
jgi:penicillin-binding protein 2